MKFALYFLVILTFSVAEKKTTHMQAGRTSAVEACEAKCTDEEKKEFYICPDVWPYVYHNICQFKCNPYGHKDVGCAEGSWHTCRNTCTPEEKRRDRGRFCDKDKEYYYTECEAKCFQPQYANDVVPCDG